MGEEIALENGRISDFHGLVTLTLTSDRVILHTVMHHSSTSTYTPNFSKVEKTFCGRTDGHLRPTNVIRSTRRSVQSDLANNHIVDLPPLVAANGFIPSWPPTNSWLLGLTSVNPASRLVQPLLHSTSMWSTDRQTNRQRDRQTDRQTDRHQNHSTCNICSNTECAQCVLAS